MLSLSTIRTSFLNYFKNYDHTIVPSSPLVPQSDPSLMFTNSGMVQFKNVFTDKEKVSYTQATSVQKCVRAGGKHNDLDNVGYTGRHHTFFEMLGNFSFGDYFKEQAIWYGFDYVHRVLGLPKDRLWVTVYHDDQEAFYLWRKIADLPLDRIVRISSSDNFWSMGDSGPCGPCSEIFYDYGGEVEGGPPGSPNGDGDRYVEIWNLVFMQYEQLMDGSRIPLAKPCIDTGMGLERISSVLQGKINNFDIDIFQTLIESSMDLTRNSSKINSHRVLADHIRSICFLMADGVMPSNEGRGYVLRRIMRRAMRHRYLLGQKDPILANLYQTLLHVMGDAYPELQRAKSMIEKTLQLEEEKFNTTLYNGMDLLKIYDHMDVLPGNVAFKLYDTYGFPIDLTQDVMKGMGKAVDMETFEKAMQNQKELSQKHWKGASKDGINDVWFSLKDRFGPTVYVGYDTLHTLARVICLFNEAFEDVPFLSPGETGWLITDRTPFYGTSGGQNGDQGYCSKNFIFETHKKCDIHGHHVQVSEKITVGDSIDMTVDAMKRHQTAIHHSATHLLHQALKDVLGDHVAQRGSLVSFDRLRFDFSHFKGMSKEEIQQVQSIVNQRIVDDIPSTIQEVLLKDAMDQGVTALFGEKYGEVVRMVVFDHASKELCGGTHVRSTSQIGYFRILSETSSSSGVRRIEALCGPALIHYLDQTIQKLNDTVLFLKNHKKAESLTIETIHPPLVQMVEGIKVIVQRVGEGGNLKSLADTIKKDHGPCVLMIYHISEGKITIVIGSHDVDFDSVTFLKNHISIIGGKGAGGRFDLAQGGGGDPNNLNRFIDTLKSQIKALKA
jgi:alanyl-tRNA synthetase